MLVAERSDLICFCDRKLKKDFGAAFCYIYTHFFGHCHVTFSYKEMLSFFGSCHVTFPNMELLPFFGRFVQKVIESCFSESFVQKTTQQSDGSCNVTSESEYLYKLFKKQPISFCKHIKKYIMSKEYCIARHDDKTCFLPNCRNHIILIGKIKDLLQKLDAFCFNYQHVDCLYTHYKYRFSGKIAFKSAQLFDNLQRAVRFNHQITGVDRMPSIAKKRLLRKTYKKHFLSSFQKPNRCELGDRIEQVKKTKFQLELIKTVDGILDGHGNYISGLVSLKTKSLYTNHFVNSKENCKNQLVVQTIQSSHSSRIQVP